MTIGQGPTQAVTAFNRFGFGARPGDLPNAARDPRGFLIEELRTANVALIRNGALPGGVGALQADYLDQQAKRIEREKMAMAPAPSIVMAAAPPDAKAPEAPKPPPPEPAKPAPPKPNVPQALFQAEARARFTMQLQAPAGFVERLVAFWSNHFAVSVAKSEALLVLAGPFEREAIRPNVLGKFSTLLRAVETHPAMILFLDNQNSIGPDAAAGRFDGAGLNENLAREILELHTLGVGSGYTQDDVTELARVLTGWSVAGTRSEVGEPGSFLFKLNWHEPGARTVLGRIYAPAGVDQGRAALDDLASHPATARHIATKLARHFVADDPAAGLVDALAQKFRDSDGDLGVVATALVSDDRAWTPRPGKVRTPVEFIVAAARATGFPSPDPGPYLNMLNLLGMPLWRPGGPNGFPDADDAWSSPEAMKMRLDLAWSMGQRMRGSAEPLTVMSTALGDAPSPETRQAVERAESREQALALVFMAPEFQRR
jgi:uncharacterized protein (DUF1800 family)